MAVDTGGQEDGAEVGYMESMGISHGVSKHIDAQGAAAIDGDRFVFITEANKMRPWS
jgi:hypothetical protein